MYDNELVNKLPRKKIMLTIDNKLLKKMNNSANSLYISLSYLIDDLIEYAVKKNVKCEYKEISREKKTVLVNPDLWKSFKNYADERNYKYNALIEAAYLRQVRNYKLRKGRISVPYNKN